MSNQGKSEPKPELGKNFLAKPILDLNFVLGGGGEL